MSPNPGAVSPRLRAQFSALPVRRSSHEFGSVCRLRGQLWGQTSAVHRTKDTTNDPIHHHELATPSAQKIPSPRAPTPPPEYLYLTSVIYSYPIRRCKGSSFH